MRVLIISDSHGNDDLVMDVYNYEMKQGLNTLLHLGDVGSGYDNLRRKILCQVLMVAGNCDYGINLPQSETVELGSHKAFMAHGHRHVDYDTTRLEYAALQNNCDIALYGHTHVPDIRQKEDILVINPGSIARPRQAGHKPTYVILTIDGDGRIRAELKFWDK